MLEEIDVFEYNCVVLCKYVCILNLSGMLLTQWKYLTQFYFFVKSINISWICFC